MCKPVAKPYHVDIRAGYRPVIRRGLRQAHSAKVDRSYDIPYAAGSDQTKNTVFIDRHMPESFEYRGRQIMVDKYLKIHERVEYSLMTALGLPYEQAHKIATDEEYRALMSDGVPLKPYTDFMAEYVKEAGDERITNPPPSGLLYLKPYMDEHDSTNLAKVAG